ncbi:radical SAM/SPASM domain-containing protein [Magnetococcus sp. PR-3]|uniref:radical SAM/SPASM domain-containing protein n=1 Tax=Magnetococcus sp. PR-3 TaxID=3120355 RepID=UPI002FCE6438
MMLQRMVKIARWGSKLLWQRPRGWHALVYNTLMAKAKVTKPLLMPCHISIEPTNVCNLRCPVCETGNHSMERPSGMMSLEDFKEIIDKVSPYSQSLMFYFMGEPFLNPYAYEMIHYARQKGMYVETCTNGERVDPQALMNSGINRISFQIGGMTQESHEVYRVKGDLSKTLEKLYALVKLNRELGSPVEIEAGFIVMKHNEHEVPLFKKWAAESGVELVQVVKPCVRNVEEGKQFLTESPEYWIYDKSKFNQGVLTPSSLPDNECTWVWTSTLVNWDGEVIPCCRDAHGHHGTGNLLEQTLPEIWNGDKMVAFRRQITQAQGQVEICKLCSGFGIPLLVQANYQSDNSFEISPTPPKPPQKIIEIKPV